MSEHEIPTDNEENTKSNAAQDFIQPYLEYLTPEGQAEVITQGDKIDPGLRQRINGLSDSEKTKALALMVTLVERQKEEKEIMLYDPVTTLPNRTLFNIMVNKECEFAQREEFPITRLVIDGDFLKDINDRHGHPIGDRALRMIAGSLQAAVRSTDIIGRTGGDEFEVVMIDTQLEEAQEITSRIRNELEAIVSKEKKLDFPNDANVEVSIGVAEWNENGNNESLDETRTRADVRMYQEKQAKKAARK